MIFLIFVFLIINLIEEPKSAHIQIEGMQTNGAVPATNIVAMIKFSPLGKKAVAAVKATTQALGLINWKRVQLHKILEVYQFLYYYLITIQ